MDGVFNQGEKKYKLKRRPGRTGTALKMANQAGLTLHGAEAAHRVFSDLDLEIIIVFEEEDT